MKTLILYATKYGAAQEVAQKIAEKIGDAQTYDLKQNNVPALDDFDCVIIGSSLYAGAIRKEAKLFITRNTNALKAKTLGLFLSGMDADSGDNFFGTNFPPELLSAAKAKAFLGGIFDPKKAGLAERMIMKTVAKTADYTNSISDEKIAQFAGDMKS